MPRTTKRVASAALTLLAVAGCSSSAKPSGSASNGSSSTAAAQAFTGTPVKAFLIANTINISQVAGGMQAAAGAVNAAGGVKGRKLVVQQCDDNSDPNQGTACANQAVADPNVYATVGNGTGYGAQINPVLEQAGMAAIGTSIRTAGDFKSSVVFPTDGGGTANILADAAFATDQLHAHTLGLAVLAIATSASAAGLIQNAVLTPRHLPAPVVAQIPQTAADVSSEAAALKGTDAVVIVTPDPFASEMVTRLRQLGYTKPIVAAEAGFTSEAKLSSEIGSTVSNFYLGAFYNHQSTGYAAFLADMKKYNPSGVINDLAASAWLATKMYAAQANALTGPLTRGALLAKMKSTSDYDTNGMLSAPLNYTVPGTALGGAVQTMFSALAPQYFYLYKNGALVPYGGSPVNAFAAPPVSS